MNRLTTSTAAAALLATALTAQANVAVFPSDHAAPAGSSRTTLAGDTWQNRFPFSAGIARQMALYDALDMTVPNGRQLTHVGFPADDTLSSVAGRIQLEIRMGHSRNDVAGADPVFANNYDGASTVVYTRKVFDLPALTGPAAVVWVPLDTPFAIDTTRNLLVEYVVTANTNSNAAFNYYLDAGRFRSEVSAYGAGCATSGGSVPQLTSQPTAIGQDWNIGLTRAAASSPVTLLVGLSRPATPIRLDAFGAPGCELLVDTLTAVGGTTNTGGAINWRFPTPFDPSIVDGHLYSQAAIPDLFANNLGVVTSNGDDLELGIRPQVALIAAIGDATAARGSVRRNDLAIALFGYR